MPVDVFVQEEPNHLTARFDGHVSVADFRRAMRKIHLQAKHGATVRILLDLRGAWEIEGRFADFLGLAMEEENTIEKCGRACRKVMLVETDLQFGMARMAEQVTDGVAALQTLVTRDPTEARTWLRDPALNTWGRLSA